MNRLDQSNQGAQRKTMFLASQAHDQTSVSPDFSDLVGLNSLRFKKI